MATIPASWSNYTLASFNYTLLNDTSLCTTSTCPLELQGVDLAHLTYLPTTAGNGLFAGIFGLFIVLQIFLGIRYRTIGFMIGAFGGLLLEVVGYVGRVMMHSDPFTDSNFIMYLCCLTIAPAFLTASIYLCLSRIVVICSEDAARFKPKTYTFFFIFCDFISLVFQGAGGGIAATANKPSQDSMGKDLMVAGLIFQVVSLSIFAANCLDLYLLYRKAYLNPDFTILRATLKFRLFLWSLAFASLFIFVRSVYRCAELAQGFHSKLANEEITFMILEGAMIVLAAGLLTALHPGLTLGRDAWAAANWATGSSKDAKQTRASNPKWWKKFGSPSQDKLEMKIHSPAENEGKPEAPGYNEVPGYRV